METDGYQKLGKSEQEHPQKVEENLIRHCNEAGTHRTETVRVKRYGRYGRYGSKGR